MNDHTTPTRRPGLRDEIAAVLARFGDVDQHAMADVVLSVLYREWPWLRAEAEDAAPADQTALRDRIAAPPAPLPPSLVSAILRDEDSPYYPSKIVVFCDDCGAEDARDYMVSTEQTSAERLEVARAQLRAEGWHCDRSGDYCPSHKADETAATETQPPGELTVTMHAIPLPGSNGVSACCGRPPCEFVGERVTRDPDKVTCTGPAAGARQDGTQR